MKKVGDFWIPDEDLRFHWHRLWKAGKHRRKTIERYANGQGEKYDDILAALAHVPGHGVAIDGGAHIGAYTRAMAQHFATIYAFEPAPDTYAALVRNLESWGLAERVHAYQAAISDHHETIRMGLPRGRRSLSRQITGPGDIPTMRIDDLKLTELDFIKLDVEGYEYRALLGAEATLRRCKPVVMFEAKGKGDDPSPDSAHEYIQSLGAHVVTCLGRRQNDWLYSF